jgi:Ca-activated chloride channel family protein
MVGPGLLVLAAPAVAAEGSDFAGDPVTPGPSAVETTAVGSGLYTLPVAEGSAEQFLEVQRTVPGSTLWYGASAEIPGASAGRAPILTLESSPDGTGEACVDYESLSYGVDENPLKSVLFSTDHLGACREAESLVLRAGQNDMPAGDYQLVVWEEPPVTNSETLPERSTSVHWTPVEPDEPTTVEPGPSYDRAPSVDDGTWSVHVVPGETALLRVPLTWGQHAQVEATSSTRAPGGGTVSARWISPLGGVLGDTAYDGGGPERREVALDGSGDAAGWVTPTVAWRNRERSAKVAPAAFAGDYYLALDAGDDVPADGADLTLSVATVTDYAPKPPDYSTDPPPMPLVDGSTPEARSATDDADRGPSWPVVGGLFGGAAVFAAAGAVLLTRRRVRP